MIYDSEDENEMKLYAGPICAGKDGSKIKVGVFLDEECNELDDTKNVDDYLIDHEGHQLKLAHTLLRKVYRDEECILSCGVTGERDDEQNTTSTVQVHEACQSLYERSAKCEMTHGFDNGYASYDRYENQLANEEEVCGFMMTLANGTHTEGGGADYAVLIVLGKDQTVPGPSIVAMWQVLVIGLLFIATTGLAGYATKLRATLSSVEGTTDKSGYDPVCTDSDG
jgi:hypothetical protein